MTDPAEVYRREAIRRGLRRAPDRLTLLQIAARAGVRRKTVDYHRRKGLLRADLVPFKGSKHRWEVDAAEAERWIAGYRWNARTGHSTPEPTEA